MTNKVNISVHPKFNRMLKLESAINGKSVYELTKSIAEKENLLVSQYLNKQKIKKVNNGVKFKF